MAKIYLPKNIREAGFTRVRETPSLITNAIAGARRLKKQTIILHEVHDNDDTRQDTELELRWSLVQGWEPDPSIGPVR